jgi:hypothetical protein
MKKTTTLIASLLLFGLANCSQRLTDFTIISSKNFDLSRSSEFKRTRNRVVGEDIAHTIIIIPTGIPNLKEALDRAIESTPGAVALVDGAVTWHFWLIPLVYGRTWYEVEGTPLVDQKLLKEVSQ